VDAIWCFINQAEPLFATKSLLRRLGENRTNLPFQKKKGQINGPLSTNCRFRNSATVLIQSSPSRHDQEAFDTVIPQFLPKGA
jgi:hypothetical protein